jgi:hypothetical protein
MNTKTQNPTLVKHIIVGRTDTHTYVSTEFLQDHNVSCAARGFILDVLSQNNWMEAVEFPSILSKEYGYLQEIENNGYCLFDKGA